MDNTFDPRELNECDKEQVHLIEAIQGFGTLLAADSSGKICYAAVGQGFETSSKSLLGTNIEDLFAGDTRRICQAIEGRSEPTTPLLIRNNKLGRWLTCIGHQQNGLKIFELEQVPSESVDIPSVEFMREKRDNLESYLRSMANNMQTVSGYDRVMIYKFAPDWHGEVVAESLKGEGQSFQGHHFPASDIPVPARNLFIQNWVRMIADANVPTILIDSAGATGGSLDLTKSILRASSKIHIEYLRNMSVAASLTLSLICDGKLWGLIACHNFTPKYVSAEERSIYSLIAKVISSRLTALSISEVVSATDRAAAFIHGLQMRHTPDQLLESIIKYKEQLRSLVPCDGFSFINFDKFIVEGKTPTKEQFEPLIAALNETGGNLLHTHAVGQQLSANLAPVAAGIIAIKIGTGWIVWNRCEVLRSEIWAGDPTKPSFVSGAQLTPRASFESWSQQIRGTSKHWQQHEIDSADRLRAILVDSLEGAPKPQVYSQNYLDILRASIHRQASELQEQFHDLHLADSLPEQ